MEPRTCFTTLIGINAYKQNALYGCIRDVLSIDSLLRDLCKQQGKDKLKYEPAYFLAPHKEDKKEIETYKETQKIKFTSKLPTFSNITTQAFAHLKQAKDGDTCVLYFSGHGSSSEAPEEFWHLKSGRQNETLVLQDSRDRENAEARDLMDKELAYLLWDALEGKKVHCIVMMDCCHAGNNTRAADNVVHYRDLVPSKTKIPFSQYIGYKDNKFYKGENGKAGIKIARYVHLAAAMDTERALETSDGGLFTAKLIDVLRAGGTGKSYRELMRTVSTMVRLRNARQNPVPFAVEDEDLDIQFFGNDIIPYKPVFDVQYINERGNPHWRLFGGAIHGLVPSSGDSKTLVKILNTKVEAEVTEVFPLYSILDNKSTATLKQGERYEASVLQLGKKLLQVAIGDSLAKTPKLLSALKKAYEAAKPVYFDIDFSKQQAEYYIHVTKETVPNYILTTADNRLPLFKREQNPVTFLQSINAVGKWSHVSSMKNTASNIKSEYFQFNIQKLEGGADNEIDDDNAAWKNITVNPDEEIVCRYVGDKVRPVIRFSVSLTGNAPKDAYNIGALYVDSKYGISGNFIRKDESTVHKNEGPINLQLSDEGSFHKTIILEIDEKYAAYNIHEITDTIKIFISNQTFDLNVFQQPALSLDDKPQEAMKGAGDGLAMRGTGSRGDKGAEEKDDWTVFSFKLRIIGPNKKRDLVAGQKNELAGLTIEVPSGLKVSAAAISAEDRRATARPGGLRGIRNEDNATVAPPPSIWGDVETGDESFEKSLSTTTDTNIEAVELLPQKEGETLTLKKGEEIVISSRQTRAVPIQKDMEETIVPYGYDEELQMYFPVGYTDEKGNIHVQVLPPPTSKVMLDDLEGTRSLGGSVKLFFKKLLRKKDIDRLVLYAYSKKEGWHEVTDNPADMEAVLKKKPGSKAVLLVHGIIGDTKDMLESMKEIADKSSFILTFDYENMSTSVDKIAGKLDGMLQKTGLYKAGMPELVIVAHSMGGLVSRWLIEIIKPPRAVSSLLLVGTPSAGSEIASTIKSVFGLLTHALNTSTTLKFAIGGLSFLLKKLQLDPLNTLTELKPGSKTIVGLSKSAASGTTVYKLIGGNTSLLKKGYAGNDFFLKKLSHALMNKLVYPGLTLAVFDDEDNDMAVTIKSMQSIVQFDAVKHTMIAASNHTGYFADKECQKYILSCVYD